jgi:hypothetical protein
MSPSGESRRAAVKEPEEKEEVSSRPPREDEPPTTRKLKRRKLRRKGSISGAEEWETVRCDAWLRELLTDSSEDESEDKYSRFMESGRWIAEMTGGRDRDHHEQEENEEMKM